VSPEAKRRERAIMEITWSWPVTILLLIVAMSPFVLPLLPQFDGRFFPVTSKVKWLDVQPADGGVTAKMSYVKLRDCEYLGSSIDRDGLPIPLNPVSGQKPQTFPTGTRVSAPWFIGSSDLEGLQLRFVHRCNPWFTTVTVAYP
jgi:hypothetical protein